VTIKSLLSHLANIRSKQPWLVLNAASQYSLARSHDPAISHFYSFETGDSAPSSFAIPDGCVDIIFDCNSKQPQALVFGTPMKAIDTQFQAKHRYFGVRFSSGVIPNFLDISAQDLIEKSFDFLDVVPQANYLVEEIIQETNFNSQVAAFKQFFSDKSLRKSSSLTAIVMRRIFDTNGNIRIRELEALTGYTSRTLQRQFRADIGMSPKAYSRIIRCQSAVYQINQMDHVNFSDMAFELGFSDQSHFFREFKKLVNATPLDYQNRVKQGSYLERIRCS